MGDDNETTGHSMLMATKSKRKYLRNVLFFSSVFFFKDEIINSETKIIVNGLFFGRELKRLIDEKVEQKARGKLTVILEFAVVSLLTPLGKPSISTTKLSDFSVLYWNPLTWSETSIFWVSFSFIPQSSEEELEVDNPEFWNRNQAPQHREEEKERLFSWNGWQMNENEKRPMTQWNSCRKEKIY